MFREFDISQIDISGQVPEEEVLRQRYFMAKCRELIQKKKEALGRDLYIHILTVGCQMNAKDSEKLLGIAREIGYVETNKEDQADLVIYNTCTVRENANQKVYGRLGYLNSLKKHNPELLIGLCGCMVQEPSVVETIQKSYRFVDMVFGTHNIFRLAEILHRRLSGEKTVIDVWKDTDKIVEDLPAERKYSFKSGVNIMFGCNNFCSYCIVPYVRGRERSRNPQDILQEIRELAADGVIEVMLLGQNVNSYGKKYGAYDTEMQEDTDMTFAKLLQEVEKVEGIERIRFMTSHPKDLSDELIHVMKESKKICRHLHLPLQSGSTEILRRMNRHYTKEQYLTLAEKIRREIPDISLTTDIIVGFPGETEEDFRETLDVVRKVQFDSAFTFIYSKRTGTPAATMDNQVPEDVVHDRFDRLLAEVQQIASKMSGRDVGTTQTVLVEGVDEKTEGYLTGRLSNNVMVHFKGEPSLIGTLVPVYLEESRGFYYLGTLQ